MWPDGGERGGCSSRYPANQSSPMESKLLFWPFPRGALLRGMLACGVTLDCCSDAGHRQLASQMRQLKPNDVGDVPPEPCRIQPRPFRPERRYRRTE